MAPSRQVLRGPHVPKFCNLHSYMPLSPTTLGLYQVLHSVWARIHPSPPYIGAVHPLSYNIQDFGLAYLEAYTFYLVSMSPIQYLKLSIFLQYRASIPLLCKFMLYSLSCRALFYYSSTVVGQLHSAYSVIYGTGALCASSLFCLIVCLIVFGTNWPTSSSFG